MNLRRPGIRPVFLTVLCGLTLAGAGQAQEDHAFADEPEAHALYDKMLATMREAQSLHYECRQTRTILKRKQTSTYKCWLQKPNHFRLESAGPRGRKAGTLVGDGSRLWLFWPGERPFFSTETEEAWKATRENVYLTEPTPVGQHSIAHKTSILGAGLMMAILNPSRFHGCDSSLDPYLDGVKHHGAEKVRGHMCDHIEVSIMKHQRSKHFWISRRDHLPRRLEEIVRVRNDIVWSEEWRNVRLNRKHAASKFAWQPPKGWKQWRLPRARDNTLKTGDAAPDFELAARGGGRLRLSDYRGKIVWLAFWRVG